jgi:hypothetical protein
VANAGTLVPPGTAAVLAASGFMLLAGFPVVAASSARHGLVQMLTTDAFRGRAFGALSAVHGLAILIGLVIGGLVIPVVGVVPVVSIGAVMSIVGGAYALARLPRHVGVAAASGTEVVAG